MVTDKRPWNAMLPMSKYSRLYSDLRCCQSPRGDVMCNVTCNMCSRECGVSVDTGCDKRNIIQIGCITYHQGVRSEGNAILASQVIWPIIYESPYTHSLAFIAFLASVNLLHPLVVNCNWTFRTCWRLDLIGDTARSFCLRNVRPERGVRDGINILMWVAAGSRFPLFMVTKLSHMKTS